MTEEWFCGAFQPDPPEGMEPYRCTESYDHPGDHRASGSNQSFALFLAQWPRSDSSPDAVRR